MLVLFVSSVNFAERTLRLANVVWQLGNAQQNDSAKWFKKPLFKVFTCIKHACSFIYHIKMCFQKVLLCLCFKLILVSISSFFFWDFSFLCLHMNYNQACFQVSFHLFRSYSCVFRVLIFSNVKVVKQCFHWNNWIYYS